MKFSAKWLLAVAFLQIARANMIKMCLYYKAAGHARTDPILVSEIENDIHCFTTNYNSRYVPARSCN